MSTAHESMWAPELIWVLRVREILLQEGGLGGTLDNDRDRYVHTWK